MSVKARRALVSVYDKSGIEDLVQALHAMDIEIISTGGTARAIRTAGVPCKDLSDITGFPEMLDGRVKTLHPRVHGALLARREDPEHMNTLDEHQIQPIDIVCVNLYPFEQTVAAPGCTFAEAIENIDIGGPTMLRSAAKNHASIYVLSSPAQYPEAIKLLRTKNGFIDPAFARTLAREVYRLTSQYDDAITAYLGCQIKN
ncbi:MAG: IMP cyclohydrolase [Gemmatimonadetes bacterium]|nr:IMP cyclohydrolase [Gemmatimonadota bacterium]|tara:strand:+ start:41 stop:643 length:603 start_codon:yes stop_codon:yes gene_type:complete